MQFRGREIAHTDLGRKLLIRFAEDLSAYGAVDGSAAHGRPQRAHPDQPGQNAATGEARQQHAETAAVGSIVRAPTRLT